MPKEDKKLIDIAAEMRAYADRLDDAGGAPSPTDLRKFAERIERAANNLESSFGMALAIEDGLRKREGGRHDLCQDTIYAGRNGEMTLDECIVRCDNNSGDDPRGRDIAQIGGWLRELRERRNARVDSSAIVNALGQCELFLLEIEKHGHSRPPPGDECVACKGVRELRSELGSVLTSALIASPSMRSTLEAIREKCVIYNNDLAEQIDAMCGNALAEPPRTCDVLTKEQLAHTIIKAMDEDVRGWDKVSEIEKELARTVVHATVEAAYSRDIVKATEPNDEQHGDAPVPDGAERGANGDTK